MADAQDEIVGEIEHYPITYLPSLWSQVQNRNFRAAPRRATLGR